jgi:hypothetical protein
MRPREFDSPSLLQFEEERARLVEALLPTARTKEVVVLPVAEKVTA